MGEPARPEVTLDALASLCKRRGFVFAGSEIYGGLANTFDFGLPGGVSNYLLSVRFRDDGQVQDVSMES